MRRHVEVIHAKVKMKVSIVSVNKATLPTLLDVVLRIDIDFFLSQCSLSYHKHIHPLPPCTVVLRSFFFANPIAMAMIACRFGCLSLSLFPTVFASACFLSVYVCTLSFFLSFLLLLPSMS